MISTLLSLVLATSLGVPQSITEDEVPAQRVIVEIVSVNGSGCPAGTTEVDVADDNLTFSVIHRTFTAKVGAGAEPTDARKNCQLALNVFAPKGFTYGIVSADYRGHANLQSGAVASQRANYYFQGSSQTTSRTHPFRGPLHDEWQTTDFVDPGSVVYASCTEQRLFNINTELRVGAGTSNPATTTSSISMDSPDRNPNTRYHFTWKRC
jgi:hypothetical protein